MLTESVDLWFVETYKWVANDKMSPTILFGFMIWRHPDPHPTHWWVVGWVMGQWVGLGQTNN